MWELLKNPLSITHDSKRTQNSGSANERARAGLSTHCVMQYMHSIILYDLTATVKQIVADLRSAIINFVMAADKHYKFTKVSRTISSKIMKTKFVFVQKFFAFPCCSLSLHKVLENRMSLLLFWYCSAYVDREK